MKRNLPLNYLDPCSAALVVIDMQEAFLGPNAMIPVPEGNEMIPRLKSVIDVARNSGMRVVWTRVFLDFVGQGPYPILFPDHFEESQPLTLSRNLPDSEIVASLSKCVAKSDIIIDKDRYSAFYQTNLEMILRDLKINTLVFSGVTTNVCVESSVRDAYNRDFYPFLISDCTATFSKQLQRASEDIISFVFGWVIDSETFKERVAG